MKQMLVGTAIVALLTAGAIAQTEDTTAAQGDLAVTEMDNPRMYRGVRPSVLREGYQEVLPDQITAEDLQDATVYDAEDRSVGEIESLIIAADGTLQGAVIEVGGFLGIGEKPVLVSMDSLSINRADEDDSVRVYVGATEEELESLDTYVD
ncbi:PRC-barrel domain-containing protein [Marivita sp. GX14005]|uniref:PRC-barrel domain-containing protein n=1 Tax=Marivita sp. GX14005 TaxID=2942276 RepID=UPI002019FF6B|nr:PRC-barrel domain-containing protein [Marivita sp. GX14005]MCL3881292.1 PRC-barrel domain-containing protein [Marivita sp. GX14005]